MKKKLFFVATAVFLVLILSGCAPGNDSEQKSEKKSEETDAVQEPTGNTSGFINSCSKEKVSLPNYGDPGERLSNCFVKYPGEPSRQDKSYYIVEDICGQFSQEFMENMLGAKLERTEPPQIASINGCSYYLSGKDYIMLNLEYLAIENQKTGNEAIGYAVAKNEKIPMENLVAVQEDGAINAIYLVLGPNKFLSLRPSSKQAIENEKFVALAGSIASEIKSYK